MFVSGADAAYAENIPGDTVVVFGYFGGPNAYHVWSDSDWARFTGKPKVPIWVAGYDGAGEAQEALRALKQLGVPPGSVIAIDLETRSDKAYVDGFYAVLHQVGYKVWVYGSAETVFNNPPCNGYWVAFYTGQPNMYQHPLVRATQWCAEIQPGWDASLVRDWVLKEMWL